jgi:hypothetical protein
MRCTHPFVHDVWCVTATLRTENYLRSVVDTTQIPNLEALVSFFGASLRSAVGRLRIRGVCFAKTPADREINNIAAAISTPLCYKS